MKNFTIATLVIGLSAATTFAQSTATNFTCNDCNNVSHTLFNELDAGKVIVLVWAMPCATCIGPSQSAYTVAQSFSSSYPGRVLFWLADDYANTSCSTLSSWATTNNMPNSTKFSNAAINMNDYGSTGMPKVVILGGASHTVFYNANNTFNATSMQTAIQNALNATTGIESAENFITSLQTFPNPADQSTEISWTIRNSGQVSIELFNMVGEKINTVFNGNVQAGNQRTQFDTGRIPAGLYFIRINAGKITKTVMLSISH